MNHRRMRSRTLVLIVLLAEVTGAAHSSDWIRPGISTNQPVWGIRGGLLWAVAPAGFRPGEPRGLIRIGYPVLPEGRYDLINFIAIEPNVMGHRGFSELEHGQLDGVTGKRIWAQSEGNENPTNLVPGRLQKGLNGEEELDVMLNVENSRTAHMCGWWFANAATAPTRSN